MSAVLVRRVSPADGPLLRALRLEALADTPIAYLETLEAATALPDGAWTARAVRGAVGGDSHQVLALDGARPVATTVVFQDADAAWLAAVYVTPSHRGTGLLARLLAPCAAWARERGATELRLEVHEDNPRAAAAYARLGFVATGERRPYPLAAPAAGAGRDELVMALLLAPT